MFVTAKQIHAGGKELQDRAEIFWLGSNLVLTVADGAGGRSGAAEAAEFATQRVKQTLGSANLSVKGLSELLESIDQQMVAAGNVGETTCVVAVLSENGIIGASVGDSGAWCISTSGVDNLSGSQSRKPFLGRGCATPIGFARDSLNGTLLVASDGSAIASVGTVTALPQILHLALRPANSSGTLNFFPHLPQVNEIMVGS